MTIGIDIDDTITKTSEIAATNLAKFDNSYTDYHNLPKERYVQFMNLYQAAGLKNVSLMEGVKEAFAYFKAKGYRIVIITARDNKYSSEIRDLTVKYLEDHGLEYDKLIFGQSSKGEIAKQEGVNIFIDDKETVLDEMTKYGIKTIHRSEINNGHHVTLAKWSDIVEYIKSQEA